MYVFVYELVVQGYTSSYSRGISLQFLKQFFSAFLAHINKMLESDETPQTVPAGVLKE